MQTEEKRPEIIVFAEPNGSGKSTITKLARVIEPYFTLEEQKKMVQIINQIKENALIA